MYTSNVVFFIFRFCHLENEPSECHPMNQSILYNHGESDVLHMFLNKEDIAAYDSGRGLIIRPPSIRLSVRPSVRPYLRLYLRPYFRGQQFLRSVWVK